MNTIVFSQYYTREPGPVNPRVNEQGETLPPGRRRAGLVMRQEGSLTTPPRDTDTLRLLPTTRLHRPQPSQRAEATSTRR